LVILRGFHDGMMARVYKNLISSKSLPASRKDVSKHRLFFNLFVVSVTLVFRNGLSIDGGIPFKYRLEVVFLISTSPSTLIMKVSSDTVGL